MTPVESSQVLFNITWSLVAVLAIVILALITAVVVKILQAVRYSARQMQEFWEDARVHLKQFSALAAKLGKVVSFFGKRRENNNKEQV
ncbi:MAG: hypothetical protein ACREHG_07635 [Candidatus Saccharimonadales bacterium]